MFQRLKGSICVALPTSPSTSVVCKRRCGILTPAFSRRPIRVVPGQLPTAAEITDPADLIHLVADPLRLALRGRFAEGRVDIDEVAAGFDAPKRKLVEAVGKRRTLVRTPG